MSQTKDRTKVVILTRSYYITGEIAHFSDTRLTDYMMEAKAYIAVTDARVQDQKGNKVLEASFLNVRNDHIEIIVPDE